ncbi:Holliday junction branch migration protein RuvA, partial [Pseudomonas sp. 2822-17]|uniref:Holliday junction branch migration protein RuvA n=1 Tax=Pseudomonas sp. 2822-17 TaxID=1712678 RepID=UPI00273AE34A
KIVHIEVDSIVIDVREVGYLVFCPNPYRFQEKLNETITVYTHHHVREDAIKLFGFSNRQEKRLFEKLLQVSGIGPK